MQGMSRLPQAPTQRVKRDSKLEFRYLGRPMTGCEGDSVASALYGNGVRIFSRSLKYHRPRGLYSLDGESANTMMTIDGIPNENAERTLLRAGMQVSAQNVSGSPETDRYGVLDHFDRLMPAGFYYKVFHRPAGLWPFFLKRIRRMAGLGVLDTLPFRTAAMAGWTRRLACRPVPRAAPLSTGAQTGQDCAGHGKHTGVHPCSCQRHLGRQFDHRVPDWACR